MKKWAQKNQTAIVIFVVIVIVLIIIFAVGRKPKGRKKGLLPGETGGEIPEGWYPDDVAATLFDAIDGIDSSSKKEAIFAKMNALNDNQKILIYNYWMDEYSQKTSWGQEFGTLTQAVRDELYTGPERVKLINNLERLKLP